MAKRIIWLIITFFPIGIAVGFVKFAMFACKRLHRWLDTGIDCWEELLRCKSK